MRAQDVMTTDVVTIRPEMLVKEVAELFVKHGISGAPVVEDEIVVGMVSEGDLLHRAELGTERLRSWWLRIITFNESLAADFVKANARHARDVMTRTVISVDAGAPLAEVAMVLERNRIKRVPVMRAGRLVGIVSRANLVQALASMGPSVAEGPTLSDVQIRARLLDTLRAQNWSDLKATTIMVHLGIVHIWGTVYSEAERAALRVAAENQPGVEAVMDHRVVFPALRLRLTSEID